MVSGSKVTIDSIVRSFLIEKGEDTKHNYMRYLHLAIQGMEDLDFDISGMPTYKEVEVSNRATINIPKDSLKIIGVHFNSGGVWIPFARSSTLSIATDDSCGVPTHNDSNTTSNPMAPTQLVSESWTNHMRNGNGTGAYYNSSVANVFLFRENDANGTIELTSNAPNKVILEYLPVSKKVNGKFMVSPFLREPLLAWMKWVSVRSKSTTSPSLSENLHRIYIMAKRQLDNRLTSMTSADFSEAINRGRTASPRF